MSVLAPSLPVDPLIAEAKQRARRRRFLLLAAAGLLAVGAAGVELAGSGSSGSAGPVPWLPTKPNIGPAYPPLAPPCTAAQLKTTMGLQAENEYQAVGEIGIVNRSSAACSLTGRPRLSFSVAKPRWRVTPPHEYKPNLFDPLAPPIGSLRALEPGRHVAVSLLWGGVWRNGKGLPCPYKPLTTLMLTAPGGGRVPLGGQNGFPHCGSATLEAGHFWPVAMGGPPSSHLPLRARIVSTGKPWLDGFGKPLPDSTVVARAGSWLSFTVVLTNTSKHTFRFGRTCPAYTEGVLTHASSKANQAYVLNCHAVGAIAPRASVRFAIRVRVPADATSDDPLEWNLAPHSFDPPAEAAAFLELR